MCYPEAEGGTREDLRLQLPNDKVLKKLKDGISVVHMHSALGLSPMDKAQLIQSLALSRLTFHFHVAPWSDQHLSEAQRRVTQALWGGAGRRTAVAALFCQRSPDRGGLGLPLVKTKYASLQALRLACWVHPTQHLRVLINFDGGSGLGGWSCTTVSNLLRCNSRVLWWPGRGCLT